MVWASAKMADSLGMLLQGSGRGPKHMVAVEEGMTGGQERSITEPTP